MPAGAQIDGAAPTERARSLAPYRGRGVTVITDLPPDRAKRLAAAVTDAAAAAAAAFGARQPGPVTVYAWDRTTAWPADQLPPQAQFALRGGPPYLQLNTLRSTDTITVAGIPVASDGRTDMSALYFGAAGDGVPERGAAAAVVSMIADAAPGWYRDGVAEVARYAVPNDPAVRISEGDLAFLAGAAQNGPTPTRIAAAPDGPAVDPAAGRDGAIPFRWALVHLLAYNPNFQERFAAVGPLLAAGRTVEFAEAFGPVERELAFEYGQFLANLRQGVDPTLTAWDWKATPRPLERRATARVDARGGWQASKALVTAGQTIAYEASGDWAVGEDDPRPAHVEPSAEIDRDREPPPRRRPPGDDLTANGGADGRGRLVAAVFDPQTLTLSEPVELGVSGSFAAPAAGHLVLRCRDDWGQLDDNRGRISVKLEPAGG